MKLLCVALLSVINLSALLNQFYVTKARQLSCIISDSLNLFDKTETGLPLLVCDKHDKVTLLLLGWPLSTILKIGPLDYQ